MPARHSVPVPNVAPASLRAAAEASPPLFEELRASTEVRSDLNKAAMNSTDEVEVTGWQGKRFWITALTKSPVTRVPLTTFPDSWPYGSADFRRRKEGDDFTFYNQGASMATHIDETSKEAIKGFYASHFQQAVQGDFSVLEIQSSWVSHYPVDLNARRVALIGMVHSELAANKQATESTVQNLNTNTSLPYTDAAFDFITSLVSVEYLTKPEQVFREMHRVLKPGGVAIVSFTDRSMVCKNVAIWAENLKDGVGLCQIVGNYFKFCPANCWENITSLDLSPGLQSAKPLWVVTAVKASAPVYKAIEKSLLLRAPQKPGFAATTSDSSPPPPPAAQELPSILQERLEAQFVESTLNSAVPTPQQKSGWLLCHDIKNTIAVRLAKTAVGTPLGNLFWKKRFLEIVGGELRVHTEASTPPLLSLPLKEIDEVLLEGKLFATHCCNPQVFVQFWAVSLAEGEGWATAIRRSVASALSSNLPRGWDLQAMLSNNTSTRRLVHKEVLPDAATPICQRLVDHCYVCKSTKDRRSFVPLRLQLVDAVRVQNGSAWIDYSNARSRVSLSQGPSDQLQGSEGPVLPLVGSGIDDENPSRPARKWGLGEMPVLTSTLQNQQLLQLLGGELDVASNEQWLFHGTSFHGVQSISDEEFRLDFAGSHRGTLYGKGIYLAECASKADEYAEPDEEGFCYMLLCRTTLGRVLECVDKSPRPDILEVCKASGYNSLCGDRWTAVHTFREFVLFEPNQVYPAFILRYRRWNEAMFCQTLRQAVESKDQDTLSRLIKAGACLTDEYPEQAVRNRLALVIGAGVTTIIELCRCLSDPRVRVRRGALLTLLQIANITHNFLSESSDLPKAVPTLIDSLSDPVPEIRRQAARCLEKLSKCSLTAVPSLIKGLEDQDPGVRAAAALALSKFSKQASAGLTALLHLTTDAVDDVRKAAVIAIGCIGKKGSLDKQVSTLQCCLKDSSNAVRCAAAISLGQVDGSVAIDDLVAMLTDAEVTVRKAAADSIGYFGAASANVISPLALLLKDSDQQVRLAAATSLRSLGIHASQAQLPFAECLRVEKDMQVRLVSLGALPRLWERNARAGFHAVQALLRALEDGKPEIRAAAAEALSDMACLGQLMANTPQVETAMMMRTKDCDAAVNRFAQACLDHIHPKAPESAESKQEPKAVASWRRTEGQMVKIRQAINAENEK